MTTRPNNGVPPSTPQALERNDVRQDPKAEMKDTGESQTNVFIRGLAPDATDDTILELCKPFGDVVSVKAIIDNRSQMCRGYGFAMFAEPIGAQGAVPGLSKGGYEASMAKESFSSRLRNRADPDSTNIYMQNIPLSMDEMQLSSWLQPFGKVLSCRILRHPDGTSRGIAFSRMETREISDRLIKSMNGTFLPGATVPVEMRFADSRAQKDFKRSMQERRMGRGRPGRGRGNMGHPGPVYQQGFQPEQQYQQYQSNQQQSVQRDLEPGFAQLSIGQRSNPPTGYQVPFYMAGYQQALAARNFAAAQQQYGGRAPMMQYGSVLQEAVPGQQPDFDALQQDEPLSGSSEGFPTTDLPGVSENPVDGIPGQEMEAPKMKYLDEIEQEFETKAQA